MYWQYKAILIAGLVLIAVGLGFLLWRSLPEGVAGKAREVVRKPFAVREEAPAGDSPSAPAVPAPPEARPESSGGAAAAVPAGPAGTDSPAARKLLDAARKQFEQESLVAARELALRALRDPAVVEFDKTWFQAAQLISEINTTFMNSGAPCPEKYGYTVQEGDSLSRIAATHDTTVGALQRLNDLDPTNPLIYPGNVLYMLKANWSIRVKKSEFTLLLLNDGVLYKLYRVGIGRRNRTPVGVFVIASKVIHPAWTPPGKHIPYGDPENVLGTHWLSLKPIEGTDPTLRGYGIHGTWQPETVGTAASAGCIRMRNEDVAELFDFIPKPRPNGKRVRVVIED